jgi:diadenosine tetraphosphate (Ap4A) HIT family hydrolase
MICPICSWSPGIPDYPLVYDSTYWRVVLAPNQCLLGRCIAQLKRHCGDVAETTPDELLDWLQIVVIMEKALRKSFDATMFNLSCYMNLSYQDSPPNPHIHWWIVPRYDHPVRIGTVTFEDPRFGNPYDFSKRLDVSKRIRLQIVEQLQRGIEM